MSDGKGSKKLGNKKYVPCVVRVHEGARREGKAEAKRKVFGQGFYLTGGKKETFFL